MNPESIVYYKAGVLLGSIEALALIELTEENVQHIDKAIKIIYQHAQALSKEIIPINLSEADFKPLAFLDATFNKMGEKG